MSNGIVKRLLVERSEKSIIRSWSEIPSRMSQNEDTKAKKTQISQQIKGLRRGPRSALPHRGQSQGLDMI